MVLSVRIHCPGCNGLIQRISELKGQTEGSMGKNCCRVTNIFLALHLPPPMHPPPSLPNLLVMCIVGNKCDLAERRAVSVQKGENLAHDIGADFLETSASENVG